MIKNLEWTYFFIIITCIDRCIDILKMYENRLYFKVTVTLNIFVTLESISYIFPIF